jgi:hypothetical protein
MESTNHEALAAIDAQFADLERKIAALDRLTDDLQTSRENIQKLDAEADRLKNDSDNLERAKRASKLSVLNASLEIERSDNSRIIAAIQAAKSDVIATGRGVRTLISTVLFQLLQAQKMRYTLLLDRELCLRKVPLRASDLANAGRDVVALKEIEDLLTRPLRGQDQELGALFALKPRFETVRTMIANEANLVLDLPTAEEPAVAEPAAELEPALT